MAKTWLTKQLQHWETTECLTVPDRTVTSGTPA